MHGVQELEEEGRKPARLGPLQQVGPVQEPVAEGEPLLLHEDPEAVDGAVEGVQAQLRQAAYLRRRKRW